MKSGYGFGVKGTVQGFVRACDEFVFLDELVGTSPDCQSAN